MGMEWVTYFDNTYWQDAGEAVHYSWTGSTWLADLASDDAGLAPIGTWSTGLRPTALIMNYGPTEEVTIKDTNGDTIGYAALYTSGEELELTFGNYDIGKIVVSNVPTDSVITNLRFFVDVVKSGVSATLDGEAVEIAEQVIERYGDYIVYIDSSNILKIKDSSITDFSTDVPMAVSASHL